MRLQLAIDRVDLCRAAALAAACEGSIDILEVGTSLVKDYGLAASVGALHRAHPSLCLLADIKTMDEGAYEFQKAYDAGAGIATVMGAAAPATIEACARVARQRGREYMIDLLEVGPRRLEALARFADAIFCIHLPTDLGPGAPGHDLIALLEESRRALPGAGRIAVAGGVSLETLPLLAEAGAEIAVVGGAITKSEDPAAAARRFRQAMATA